VLNKAVMAESTGNIYFYENVWISTKYYTSIHKEDPDGTSVWEKIYEYFDKEEIFDIAVTPDDSNLFYLTRRLHPSPKKIELTKVNAPDGEVIESYNTGIGHDNSYEKVTISPDGTKILIIGKETISVKGAVCIGDTSSLSTFECSYYNNKVRLMLSILFLLL
jgi:WD40 repeat protein